MFTWLQEKVFFCTQYNKVTNSPQVSFTHPPLPQVIHNKKILYFSICGIMLWGIQSWVNKLEVIYMMCFPVVADIKHAQFTI